MKCLKCKCKNSYKSNYCFQCGHSFTEDERKRAEDSKIVKVLKTIKGVYDRWNLSFITGNIYFRIFSVVVVLFVSLFGIVSNGFKFRLEKSDDYRYQYNKKTDEYYLYTKEEKTGVNFYVLGDVDNINVSYYEDNGTLIEENNYSDYNDIYLTANTIRNNYYIITCKNDKLKLYVYNE